MIAKEFLRRRVAPLQKRSHPVWEITGAEDQIRLARESLSAEAVAEA